MNKRQKFSFGSESESLKISSSEPESSGSDSESLKSSSEPESSGSDSESLKTSSADSAESEHPNVYISKRKSEEKGDAESKHPNVYILKRKNEERGEKRKVFTSHRDFKSLVAHVQTAKEIANVIGLALCHQHALDIKTSPWEKERCNPTETENFRIEIRKIDRLYRIRNSRNTWFYLLARIEYETNDFIFVELEAWRWLYWEGSIFMTRYAFLFSKIIYPPCDVRTLIYGSLRNDGYIFEEASEHDRRPACLWTEPPTLKYLCIEKIYWWNKYFPEETQLKHYSQVLPEILKTTVNEFGIIREAINDYDSWNFYTRTNPISLKITTHEDLFRCPDRYQSHEDGEEKGNENSTSNYNDNSKAYHLRRFYTLVQKIKK